MSDHEDWFEFNLEHSPYAGGGYDTWLTSEPLLEEPERSQHREPQRCGCGGRENFIREKGCTNCGKPWRCDCNGGRGRSGVDVCWSCGRKAER